MTSGNQYTRERLEEAAASCANLDEVIAFLGTTPYSYLHRYLMRRFAHFGIDVSHFPSPGRRQPPAPEVLRNVVAESKSIAEVLRRLALSDCTTSRVHFREWVSGHGLDTSHFLGQAHGRGKQGKVRPAQEILIRHDGRYRTKTHLLRRALREVGVPERCVLCGVGPEWLGRPMTLEVDHIDGDWRDDRRENLRLLCPNCHAITDTWCRGGRRRPPTSAR
ncbi:HNH endonuclease signature motif containing protein [Streptomyces sp. NPDC046203]|uniref:HNH endonuclease n=1 Tax=Streptomyces sp. NPDC046203 TaxID=3154602 RepID=UPI003407F809